MTKEINNRTLLLFGIVLLLIGLVIGYGFGYVIYQPQIQNLQSKFADLDSTVKTMENRTWHMVYSLSSSSDVTTGLVHLRGKQVRVMWIATAISPSASLSIELHFSNGTAYAVWGSSGVWTANNAVLELSQTGNYYLEITTYQTTYDFSIWDYY